MLEMLDVEVGYGRTSVIHGVTIEVPADGVAAVMGHNGAGKTTLLRAAVGLLPVRSGRILLDGEDVTEMSVDERARAGLFLAMQYPVEIPGVTMSNFLRSAKTAVDGEAPALRTWTKDVKEAVAQLKMDPQMIQRNVNEGFSGGEKKRM